MDKKVILLFVAFLIFINLDSVSGDRYKSYKIVANEDALRGDTGPLTHSPTAPFSTSPKTLTPPVIFASGNSVITITEVSTSARTHYDLQSNGTIRYCVQDPSNANTLHGIFMVATDPTPWATRNVRYFFSSNGGTTWDYVITVYSQRSGFPSLTQKFDGSAVVLAHSGAATADTRTRLGVDVAPGAGSFTILDGGNPSNNQYIWPVGVASSNNKVLWVASINGQDSAFRNVCTNLNSPGTFLGYQNVPNSETAQQYACAIGTTKWGIAFCTFSGGASLIESTDQGVTWGAPQTIWTYNNADSTGTLRSIDMIYQGDNPRVFLGLGHVDPVGGTFAPGLPSKQVYWSPNINGGNAVTIDSADGLVGSNPTNDVFFSVARGVIGKSLSGNNLYVAYNKKSGDTSSLGNDFFDVWYRYSTDNGATWGPKTKVTNNSGPLVDCRYVSISPTNAGNNINLIFQQDSIAASSVNGAPDSEAKMMYAKITDVIGIKNISSDIPASYSLSQNYPNPFNPSTKIKFAIPKSGLVTLRLYDALGKEISQLFVKELNAGTYEYELNAASLASGIYFYSISASDFSASKKMVLIK